MKKGNETICALLDKVMRQHREIDNYKEQIALMERQNSGRRNDYLVKKDKNDFLTKENAELHREVEKLREENERLRSRASEASDVCHNLKEENNELKAEKEELKFMNRLYQKKYSGKHCCLALGCPFLMREDDE